uniref:Uncharacterized protein n=1 Tax=Malurus cyaneus samueli TaxID=2593467 RepID=A0A8C5U4W4_9PASS
AAEERDRNHEKLCRAQYIFPNCVSCILQYLSTCIVGASLGSPDEEEEEEEENDSDVEVPTTSEEDMYKIVGTLSKPGSPNPPFAKEIYTVSMILISDCH